MMSFYVDGTNLSARCAEPGATHDRLSALLARVAAGDRAGMAALYDETSPLIFGLLTRVLGAGTMAEEALIEVYSRVWRKAASYSPESGSPIAWLVKTARECAFRKNLPDQPDGQPREPSKLPTRNEATFPERNEAARAREALGGLAPKQKEALQLSYLYGLRRAESAFGLAPEEARSLVSGALRGYAEMLGSLGND